VLFLFPAMPPPTTPRPARTVIFANGEIHDLDAAQEALRPSDVLIAADGGLQHMLRLGLRPHRLVGDLDSADRAAVAALQGSATRIERFPTRKDETDLELALRLARRSGAEDILIFGALGGRWDQTLGNLLLLAHPDYRTVRVRLLDGAQQIYLIQGTTRIEGHPGDTVSLIPLRGDAVGVTTEGLEYPLAGGTLPFGSTLGISNVLQGEAATVQVVEGLVVCVVIGFPGRLR
jgi:thiamine pyrophosphokinase